MNRQHFLFFVVLILFVSTINNVSASPPIIISGDGLNEKQIESLGLFPPSPPKMHFIYTENDLKAMEYSRYPENYFYLMNDIEITDAVWMPIGSASEPFSGDFYGNNNTIILKNDVTFVSLGNQNDDGYGFFGNIECARIYDLNLVFQGNVTSEFSNTGALVGKVGFNDYEYRSGLSMVINCTVQSESHTISKEKKVGEFIRNAINCIIQSIKHMFLGEKKAGISIENMKNDMLQRKEIAISGENNVGGLVGNLADGHIYNCSSDFSVIAKKDNAGGLVGYIYTGMVENSSASGSVEAKGENAGGLVGYIQLGNASSLNDYLGYPNITITNSSATNAVKSQGHAGGLIGYISNSIVIENSSASGPVDPPGKFGNFIGGWNEEHKPEVISCFYQDEEVDLTAPSS